MFDPVGLGKRMIGWDVAPDALWWLLSAVVGFYFATRGLQKVRRQRPAKERMRDIQKICKLKTAFIPVIWLL